VTKVPFFGDLPVVGYLFKTTNKINDRTELLIFITPRIVSERINAASLR
jgi:type IV pilus assembly protein PilQ